MPDVEALFRDQHDHLRRTLRRRFNSAVSDALIEDACASAWAIAWARRDRIPEDNPVGWLVVVARHEVLALLRKRRAECAAEAPPMPSMVGDPELALEARQRLELLNRLRPNQRVVLTLRAAGFSYEEIVAMTGKTYTWTNRHVTEGRARLRALVASEPR